ncbi:MAG: hypothetical protein OEM41_04215 [Ignavibacteria bacterium]|nr:hypothetical protein [Ignavibacteria bacterium]
MNVNAVLRYVLLVLSSAAMAVGVLVMMGTLHVNFPEQFRVIVGAVVFLYGGYRFVISYFRKPNRNGNDNEAFR